MQTKKSWIQKVYAGKRICRWQVLLHLNYLFQQKIHYSGHKSNRNKLILLMNKKKTNNKIWSRMIHFAWDPECSTILHMIIVCLLVFYSMPATKDISWRFNKTKGILYQIPHFKIHLQLKESKSWWQNASSTDSYIVASICCIPRENF